MDIDIAVVDKLLTTTRTVRKRLDFDREVEPEVLERCIEIAMQAPTGSNQQHWHFMVVTDPEKKKVVGDCYKRGYYPYRAMRDEDPPKYEADDPRAQRGRPDQGLGDASGRKYASGPGAGAGVLRRPGGERWCDGAGQPVRLDFAGGVVPDAGTEGSGAGGRVDNATPSQ